MSNNLVSSRKRFCPSCKAERPFHEAICPCVNDANIAKIKEAGAPFEQKERDGTLKAPDKYGAGEQGALLRELSISRTDRTKLTKEHQDMVWAHIKSHYTDGWENISCPCSRYTGNDVVARTNTTRDAVQMTCNKCGMIVLSFAADKIARLCDG